MQGRQTIGTLRSATDPERARRCKRSDRPTTNALAGHPLRSEPHPSEQAANRPRPRPGRPSLHRSVDAGEALHSGWSRHGGNKSTHRRADIRVDQQASITTLPELTTRPEAGEPRIGGTFDNLGKARPPPIRVEEDDADRGPSKIRVSPHHLRSIDGGWSSGLLDELAAKRLPPRYPLTHQLSRRRLAERMPSDWSTNSSAFRVGSRTLFRPCSSRRAARSPCLSTLPWRTACDRVRSPVAPPCPRALRLRSSGPRADVPPASASQDGIGGFDDFGLGVLRRWIEVSAGER